MPATDNSPYAKQEEKKEEEIHCSNCNTPLKEEDGKEEEKVLDLRVWNFPKEIKTQFASDLSFHSISGDFFRVSFFERRITVGKCDEENQMDCVFTLGISRNILERFAETLNKAALFK